MSLLRFLSKWRTITVSSNPVAKDLCLMHPATLRVKGCIFFCLSTMMSKDFASKPNHNCQVMSQPFIKVGRLYPKTIIR